MLSAAKGEILSVVIPLETFFSSGANLIKNANLFSIYTAGTVF
jgi:hypothetical protein